MNRRWERLTRHLPALDTARLDLYVDELVRWNKAIRLVGPKDAEGVRQQVMDSLLPYLYSAPRFPLLDIGSGAGLPAIPLAIAHPGQQITALEPLGKRVSFLRHAVRSLSLEGFAVIQGRAGEAEEAHPQLAASFQCVTARAVADVETLLAWAAPYLAPGGIVLLGRGDEARTEVAGWRISHRANYLPPEGMGERFVVSYLPDN